ncbi:MAG: energy transducer TonB [Bacteroidota bacterium]
MNVKKNPNANLENKRGIFFLIGLAIALSASYFVLEYESPVKEIKFQTSGFFTEIMDDLPPVTKPKEPKKPKPLPLPAKIEVLDNISDITDDPIFDSSEDEADEPIDIFEPIEVEEETKPFKFYVVEDLPLFPGCEHIKDKKQQESSFWKEISKHVRKHFKYPEIAKEMGIEGKVYVQFIIKKDGSVDNIIIARGVDKSLDNESLRIVKKLPKLTPAKQRGKPVSVSFILPITFKLN